MTEQETQGLREETRTIREIVTFVKMRFPPLKYILYCSIWTTSLLAHIKIESARAHYNPQQAMLPSFLSGEHIWAFVYSFMTLLFMRVIDEIKDLPYDKIFHPSRVLPSGRVGLPACWAMLGGIGAVALGLSFFGPPAAGMIAFTIFVYSCALLFIDNRSVWFAEQMYLNLIFSCQLKTLGIILIVCCLVGWENIFSFSTMTFGYLLAYLTWETSRKSVKRERVREGERNYSNETGYWGSLGVSLAVSFVSAFLLWLGSRNAFVWIPPTFFAAGLFAHKLLPSVKPGTVGFVCYLLFLFSPFFSPLLPILLRLAFLQGFSFLGTGQI